MSTIPTSLTEKQFDRYIRPFISTAKRGYECKIPLYKVFNYILYRLHTGFKLHYKDSRAIIHESDNFQPLFDNDSGI